MYHIISTLDMIGRHKSFGGKIYYPEPYTKPSLKTFWRALIHINTPSLPPFQHRACTVQLSITLLLRSLLSICLVAEKVEKD